MDKMIADGGAAVGRFLASPEENELLSLLNKAEGGAMGHGGSGSCSTASRNR
jgi:hypothetical protein